MDLAKADFSLKLSKVQDMLQRNAQSLIEINGNITNLYKSGGADRSKCTKPSVPGSTAVQSHKFRWCGKKAVYARGQITEASRREDLK